MFTGGIVQNNGPQLYKDLNAAMPDAKLFGPDGVAAAEFTKELPAKVQAQTYLTVPTLSPEELPPSGQQFYKDFEAEYGKAQDEIAPYAVYGYEAMAVVCDAIAQGGDDEQAVIDAFFATKGRESPLGTYDIDPDGDTTLSDYGAYTAEGGELVFNKVLKAAAELGHRHDATAAGRLAGPPPAPNQPMESASIPARPPRARGEVVREFVSRCGLIAILLILPVAYGIQDLQDEGDLGRLATNIKDGLSNGAIWALIAVGYTLVYGIIELINFAHGDLFMLGSFIVARADRHRRSDRRAPAGSR